MMNIRRALDVEAICHTHHVVSGNLAGVESLGDDATRIAT
jgi:hypothetical protein